ncbi:MAG: ABC transporter permease subunit [Oscillospiraceae bacterium]|nr:ABC transporter permease subunit [Oscillospiraceae bacterium]
MSVNNQDVSAKRDIFRLFKEGPQNRRQDLIRRIWKYKVLYFFILPMVAWFIIFQYIPMGGNLLAFKDYSFRKGILGSDWVGLRYFRQFFGYYDFWNVTRNTIVIALMKILLEFPFPIIFALLLNELYRTGFKRVVQSLSYLPHFVSWVIVIQMFTMLLSPTNGILNHILLNFGILKEPIFFLGERNLFLPVVFTTDIFKGVGWSSIIYLSTLSSINMEVYEAASIDGASRMQKALNITLPAIVPTAGLLFILGFSGILRSGFDQIYLLQSPGNLRVSETLDTIVFKQGILNGNISYSTAVGFFQSFISLMLLYLVNKIAQKTGELSLW